MKRVVILFSLIGLCGIASAEPDCVAFIAALKGAAPDQKMDKDGEAMFTKVCKRNTEAVVKTATTCLQEGKGKGDPTLDKCLKPLK